MRTFKLGALTSAAFAAALGFAPGCGSDDGGNALTVMDGKNSVCDGNTKWTDANQNKLFEPTEAGDVIACGQ